MIPAPEAVFTIAPPPCFSISGISYFMHRKTPLRLMRIMRSHSSSLISAVAVIGCSTPALLKAKSSRPNTSIALSSAAFTSSARDTSHLTASARPPSSSICAPSPDCLLPKHRRSPRWRLHVRTPAPLRVRCRSLLRLQTRLCRNSMVLVHSHLAFYLTGSTVALPAPDVSSASKSPISRCEFD